MSEVETDLDVRIAELLRRAKKTTRSRYRASERLEWHHKFSQWTVSMLSVSLVFIPLLQTFRVEIDVSLIHLSAIQAILAILLLVYSLLLGQENFISRSEAMHRNGVELGRFSRKLTGYKGEIEQDDYQVLVDEYYGIIEKYENHKPVDYLFTRLNDRPSMLSEWPEYAYVWIRAQLFRALIYSHYVFVLLFVLYIMTSVVDSIVSKSTIVIG